MWSSVVGAFYMLGVWHNRDTFHATLAGALLVSKHLTTFTWRPCGAQRANDYFEHSYDVWVSCRVCNR